MGQNGRQVFERERPTLFAVFARCAAGGFISRPRAADGLVRS
jgi:hypothetical protein